MVLILYIAFIILVLVGVDWLKHKISQWNVKRVLNSVFRDAQVRQPTLKIGSSYSWPTFDITFSTKEDLEFAKSSGLIDQFKNRMRLRYTKDFDPDKAIYCTYVGHVPLWTTIAYEKVSGKGEDKA